MQFCSGGGDPYLFRACVTGYSSFTSPSNKNIFTLPSAWLHTKGRDSQTFLGGAVFEASGEDSRVSTDSLRTSRPESGTGKEGRDRRITTTLAKTGEETKVFRPYDWKYWAKRQSGRTFESCAFRAGHSRPSHSTPPTTVKDPSSWGTA